MAQITTLKDKGGKTLYPLTSSQAVLDAQGVDLDTRLNNKVEKEQGKVLSSNDYTDGDKQKLDSLPTGEQLTTTLNGKQSVLQDSDDVLVDGSQLSLTERAKMQPLIDQFNYLANRVVANYGGYNEDTGFFELGDVKDITAPQAMKIVLSAGSWAAVIDAGSPKGLFAGLGIRAAFPMMLSGGGQGHSQLANMFAYSNVEEVCFVAGYANNLERTFEDCAKLKKITLPVYTSISSANRTFRNCSALETIVGLRVSCSLDLGACLKLSYASIATLITKAANTSAITFTVHKNVYAKLTGDETNAAYTSLTDEEKAQWTALLAAAAEKNIQFASA